MRYRVTLWDLEPGSRLSRSRLHDRFGGNRRRGISPSRQSPNIFLFSRPGRDETYGYLDDLEGNPVRFSGEGQKGDQELTAGNAAILRHRETGKTLRLFRAEGTDVEYLGSYEIDQDNPYEIVEAPDRTKAGIRKIFLFRLLRTNDG